MEEPTDEAVLEAVSAKGYADHHSILKAVAEEFAIGWIDLAGANWPSNPDRLLSEADGRRFRAFPLSGGTDRLKVAISDPLEDLDTLSHLLGKQIEPVLAQEEDVDMAIDSSYLSEGQSATARLSRDEQERVEQAAKPEGTVEIESALTGEDDAPIIRLVQVVISEAIRLRASDIHLEPLEERFRLRYRVDGTLQEVPNPPPKHLQLPVISRIHRHAYFGQVQFEAGISGVGIPARRSGGLRADDRHAGWHAPGDGADRIGQDHHAL